MMEREIPASYWVWVRWLAIFRKCYVSSKYQG